MRRARVFGDHPPRDGDHPPRDKEHHLASPEMSEREHAADNNRWGECYRFPTPFARTKAERLAAGDQRLSIEERYPNKETYVAAVKTAADALVVKRYLLPEDATRLVSQAERDGIRSAP
jgi:hypothetical protein